MLSFASEYKFCKFERPILLMFRAVPYHPGEWRNPPFNIFGLNCFSASSARSALCHPRADDHFLKHHDNVLHIPRLSMMPSMLNMQAQQGRSTASSERGKSERKWVPLNDYPFTVIFAIHPHAAVWIIFLWRRGEINDQDDGWSVR